MCVSAFFLVSFLTKPVCANESLFERDVLPILTKNCLGCHGGLRQKGGLEMRTIAAVPFLGDSAGALRGLDG